MKKSGRKYEFQVVGYVVMPEHIHLLIGEPDERSVAVIMQVLKQRVSRRRLARGRSRLPQEADPPPFWYPRSYDFNVFSEKKIAEKLDYMHWNPVKRGLVASPEQWRWSSYRFYAQREEGPVRSAVNDTHPLRRQSDLSSHTSFRGAKDGAPTLWWRKINH